MKTTDQGILLHRFNYSDSSLIISYLTKESGLQKFIFKGGKKKSANLYPLSISELTFYPKKDGELFNLISADSSLPSSFQFNPVRSAIAFFMAEMVNKSAAIGQQDNELYSFLVEAIRALDTSERIRMLPIEFTINLCQQLGFNPRCDDPEKTVFNLTSGTFQLTGSGASNLRSGKGALLIQKFLLQRSFDAEITNYERLEALEIMLDYFTHHVPNFQKIESYEVVKEVINS